MALWKFFSQLKILLKKYSFKKIFSFGFLKELDSDLQIHFGTLDMHYILLTNRTRMNSDIYYRRMSI